MRVKCYTKVTGVKVLDLGRDCKFLATNLSTMGSGTKEKPTVRVCSGSLMDYTTKENGKMVCRTGGAP